MSRSITINLLLAAIGLALLWLLTWPVFERVRELRASAKIIENEIAAEKEAITKLAELEREVGSHEDALDRLELAIPAKRDIASALAVFEEVANANGLVLNAVQFTEESQPSAKKPAVQVVNALLKLEGRYGSLQTFFEDVEETFPLMDVVSVSFLVPQKTGVEEEETLINPILDITLSLETYYRNL